MKASALTRKSWTDLTRRRARALFAVATLAIAISSVGIFALTPLLNRAMSSEVRSSKLHDVQMQMAPVTLTPADLAAIRALPNVKAVETRAWFMTRIYIGQRRQKALVMGVGDFAHQTVDVVSLTSGEDPPTGSVAVDVQDSRQGVFPGKPGETVKVMTSAGGTVALPITAQARSLVGGQLTHWDYAVVYATPATLATLTGSRAIGSIELRLRDTSQAAAQQAVADVRAYLRVHTTFTGFSTLPDIRQSGKWPGQDIVENLGSLIYVITVLALISGLFLISNTMSTLVAEQTTEIGIMKAIGGRRRQIAASYLRTAVLMGALGSAVGVPLGIVISNLLTGYFADTFYGVSAGFGVDAKVTALSLVIGLLGPALASLPAIRRATAVPVRVALSSAGGEPGSDGAIERLLRRLSFLPKDAQIGVRSLGRRKRRSIGTTILVALAVANLLALLALGKSVSAVGHRYFQDANYDLVLSSSDSGGTGRPFDARAGQIIAATPGVKVGQPVVFNQVKLAGRDTFVYALPSDSILHERLSDGRLFTSRDHSEAAHSLLVERGIASATGIDVGDTATLSTAAGDVRFRVVGLLDNSSGVMGAVYIPLETGQRMLGMASTANQYWVQTSSSDHRAVDRTTTRLEDALVAHGYSVSTQIRYVTERQVEAQNSEFTTIITVLGFLVVGISLIGLINAMTANILERTREIGVLRCIGARNHDIRRIFATEGLTLSLLGWAAGIPLGYLADVMLMRVVDHLLDLRMPFLFPTWNPPLALAGTIVLSLLVMVLPLRKATRFHAGEALRYQ
jgi:putative ABC transport system permease protein